MTVARSQRLPDRETIPENFVFDLKQCEAMERKEGEGSAIRSDEQIDEITSHP